MPADDWPGLAELVAQVESVALADGRGPRGQRRGRSMMDEDERAALRERASPPHGRAKPKRPRRATPATATTAPVPAFLQPGSRTRVVGVSSGKGGVGKSSVTVNLAIALGPGRPLGRRSSTPTSTASRCPRCWAATGPGDHRRHGHPDPGTRGALPLDGLLRPRGPAGHLAGADAAQGDRAVPGRRLLGRARLPAGRHAPRDRRRHAVARPGDAEGRDRRGHHPPGGRPTGRPALGLRRPQAEAVGARGGREHELVHRRRRHPLRAVRPRRRRRAGRRPRACRSSAQMPLVPALREGGDTGTTDHGDRPRRRGVEGLRGAGRASRRARPGPRLPSGAVTAAERPTGRIP